MSPIQTPKTWLILSVKVIILTKKKESNMIFAGTFWFIYQKFHVDFLQGNRESKRRKTLT